MLGTSSSTWYEPVGTRW